VRRVTPGLADRGLIAPSLVKAIFPALFPHVGKRKIRRAIRSANNNLCDAGQLYSEQPSTKGEEKLNQQNNHDGRFQEKRATLIELIEHVMVELFSGL
jgi:hypothetical protein